MNNPKISVIIPVYNTEKYLKRCLNSVVNQNFKNIEIIIINDFSPDNSLETIKEFLKIDKRIILINKLKNEGLSAARNTGLEIARGEYILHIDSDDWIEQNYLEDLYKEAKKNNSDIVITDFYMDYDNGKLKYCIDQKIEQEYESQVFLQNCFIGQGYICVWNKLIRKSLYIENNIKHPINISLGEDLAVIPKLFYYSKKITKLNKAYVHYIQNINSITKTNDVKKVIEISNALKILNEFFNYKNNYYFQRFELIHLGIWLFKEKYDFNNEEYYEIVKKYLHEMNKIKIKSLKMKIVVFVLKIFNEKMTFIILWHIQQILKNRRNRK